MHFVVRSCVFTCILVHLLAKKMQHAVFFFLNAQESNSVNQVHTFFLHMHSYCV